jgi:hypothetical protein
MPVQSFLLLPYQLHSLWVIHFDCYVQRRVFKNFKNSLLDRLRCLPWLQTRRDAMATEEVGYYGDELNLSELLPWA